MNKIATLYLCTGDYVFFWENFFKSFEENFLPNSEKHYFVWTDSENIYEEQHPRVHKIYKECLGFPNETLMRYHTFLTIEEEIMNFDYVFFMNSNLICNEVITEKEFLPAKGELLVAQHPGKYFMLPSHFPYERRSTSTAYIPYNQGSIYIFGAINGAAPTIYYKMIHQLKNNIDIDLQNNIVAIWHDESHLNKYIVDKKVPLKILNADYCNPENWQIPFNKKIIVLDKIKYINIDKIKRGKI